jgi:guanyl-specific ribonuclease Sa
VQPAAELPVPAAQAVDFDLQEALTRGGNAGCTPNPAIAPGTDFSPTIHDPVRTAAIIELLGKISACKPLPYSHDGIVNNNSEGHLPQAPVGYYKEYTLIVPGRNTGDGPVAVDIGGKTYMTGSMLSARGPERIMIGGGQHIYYTPDHYATFIELTIVK